MNSGLTGLTFSPLGDRALLLELGGRADPLTVSRVRALAEYLGQQELPGVLDLVPALCTLGVHYDPETWRDDTGKHSPYENLVEKIQDVLPDPDSLAVTDGHLYEVPVCYDGEYGEDLPSFARAHDLARKQVVEIHSASVYTVYMLGFAPGFVYLGQLDERLVSPRRDTPRASVPAGSVAVANQYTGIYPASLPGGWHIIGRTPLQLFDLSRDRPSLLSAGDRVRFVPVSAARFRELESTQS
jgi:inhibitor of KinA